MNNILVINNELNVIDNEYVSYKDNVITFKKNCDYDLIYENNVNISCHAKLSVIPISNNSSR